MPYVNIGCKLDQENTMAAEPSPLLGVRIGARGEIYDGCYLNAESWSGPCWRTIGREIALEIEIESAGRKDQWR